MTQEWQSVVDRLVRDDAAAGAPPSAWFERLYAGGARGEHDLPWDREAANPLLVAWTEGEQLSGDGRRALVVGAGLGREAGHVARLGFDTTAFDVSPTAVRLAAAREPDARFVVADLLALPPDWHEAFDLVVEIYTVQALPVRLRDHAVAAVASTVALGGRLLVVQVVREDDEEVDGPPWPLTEAEVRSFADHGLDLDRLEREDTVAPGVPAVRWCATFSRPAAS